MRACHASLQPFVVGKRNMGPWGHGWTPECDERACVPAMHSIETCKESNYYVQSVRSLAIL